MRKGLLNAHDLVYGAVKSGVLPPANSQTCASCGAQAKDYHHGDYAKPLDVIPLCRKCHKAVHRSEKMGRQVGVEELVVYTPEA